MLIYKVERVHYWNRLIRDVFTAGETPRQTKETKEKGERSMAGRLNKYLIRMFEPSDWLESFEEGTQQVNQFIKPYGPNEKNEMSDTVYHLGGEVGYHEHRKGFETFFIRRGKVQCTVRGKRFILEEGDIIHLPPYVAHGFVHLEEGTVWRELFQEINLNQQIHNKNLIYAHYPEYFEDTDFQDLYQGAYRGRIVRQEPAPVDVPKESMWEVRTPGFGYSTYKFDGLTMRLVVGRWETNGVKEVWEADMEKGLEIHWDYPFPDFNLFYIRSGKIKFNVLGEEFEATDDCLVHIPPYATHSLEVLEDAKVYDCGCSARLLDLFEDIDSLKAYSPEKLKDEAYMTQFKHDHECYVTSVSKK